MRRLVKRQAEQEEEDDEDLDEGVRSRGEGSSGSRAHGSSTSGGKAGSSGSGGRKMTEAEKRFEEVQKKRVSREMDRPLWPS